VGAPGDVTISSACAASFCGEGFLNLLCRRPMADDGVRACFPSLKNKGGGHRVPTLPKAPPPPVHCHPRPSEVSTLFSSTDNLHQIPKSNTPHPRTAKILLNLCQYHRGLLCWHRLPIGDDSPEPWPGQRGEDGRDGEQERNRREMRG
jgi:hypothetical protein